MTRTRKRTRTEDPQTRCLGVHIVSNGPLLDGGLGLGDAPVRGYGRRGFTVTGASVVRRSQWMMLRPGRSVIGERGSPPPPPQVMRRTRHKCSPYVMPALFFLRRWRSRRRLRLRRRRRRRRRQIAEADNVGGDTRHNRKMIENMLHTSQTVRALSTLWESVQKIFPISSHLCG